jgi:hypothetical protein
MCPARRLVFGTSVGIRAEVNGKRTYLAATAAGTPRLGSPTKYRGAARTAPPRGSLVHPAGASSRRHHSIHRQHDICLSALALYGAWIAINVGLIPGCPHSIHLRILAMAASVSVRRLLGRWRRTGSLLVSPTPASRREQTGAATTRKRNTGPSPSLATASAAEGRNSGRSGSDRPAATAAEGGSSGRPGPSFAGAGASCATIVSAEGPSGGSATAGRLGRSGSGGNATTTAEGGSSGRPGPSSPAAGASCAADVSAESTNAGSATAGRLGRSSARAGTMTGFASG